MISRTSLAFAVFLVILLLFSRAHAGPFSSAGFAGNTLVVKIKSNKHKHDHAKNKGKDQSDENASESDEGSKEAKTAPDSNAGSQASSKTTTTPNAATTNQNVLWGDYFYVTPKQ